MMCLYNSIPALESYNNCYMAYAYLRFRLLCCLVHTKPNTNVLKSLYRCGIYMGLLNYIRLFTEEILSLLLWCRVPVCFWECVAPMAVLLLMQVARREREWSSFKAQRRGEQPPSTPCAWAHSVMKWPVSWRPCPNNGPIQPGEESLSGPGWIWYLWFRAAVPLSLHPPIFYSLDCSCNHPAPLIRLVSVSEDVYLQRSWTASAVCVFYTSIFWLDPFWF